MAIIAMTALALIAVISAASLAHPQPQRVAVPARIRRR
jgi:hypothetical protein